MNFWYDQDEKNIIKYLHLISLNLDLNDLDILLKKYKLSKEDKLYMEEFLKELKELNKEDYFVSSISKEKDLEMIANTEREIGFEKGIKKGIKEGMEQGSMNTIKSFIKSNIPLSKISEATGLSIKELQKLKATLY